MSGKTIIESTMKYRNPDVFMGLPGISEYKKYQTDEKIIKEKRNKVYELWEFAEFDENENNKIEIRVNWKESNKQHSQVLKLKMYYGRTNYILRRVKRFLL